MSIRSLPSPAATAAGLLLALAGLAASHSPAQATTATATTAATADAPAAGARVVKSTLVVVPRRHGNYWPNPAAKEPSYNTWCWVPRISFNVYGPLEAGSQLSVTFTKPGGAPWGTVKLKTPELDADHWETITTTTEWENNEKAAITAIGPAGFTINLDNALTGKKSVLFTGKYEVKKFHSGVAGPKSKNEFEYYADFDWLLPIGYYFLDDAQDENAPPLKVRVWFLGANSTDKLAAYVYCKGKQISSTKTTVQGAVNKGPEITTSGSHPKPRWERFEFTFFNVRGFNTSTSNNRYEAHFLDKNPGEYEIKWLYDGTLARTAKFTVGEDGKVVDNGLATKNKLGASIWILPIKVVATPDGTANLEAYKTGAFYGNPLVDFVVP